MMMTTKSCLSRPFLLLLLLLPSSTVSGSVVRTYYVYIPHLVTWQDAQRHCRSSNTDLPIIYTQSDIDRMPATNQYSAWIGLHKREGNLTADWVWSDGQHNNYNSWAQYQPSHDASCAVARYSYKRFYGTSCGGPSFFICHKRKEADKYEYTFIPQSKTWSEAQQYCRDQYDDLATIKDDEDRDLAVTLQDFPVWTGLHRDGETWTELLEYQNWASGELGNNGDCVSISSLNKEMATQNCSSRFPFVCFRDNLVLVKENKTWEEALEHCRALKSPHDVSIFYDLISVQPGEENNYMNKVMKANTEMVWTGLRFLAGHWLWMNRDNMLYSDLPLCPLEEQQCGALSQNDTGSVEITDCSEKRNFLCYSSV